MTTAITVLAWLAAIWLALSIGASLYALHRIRKDWRR